MILILIGVSCLRILANSFHFRLYISHFLGLDVVFFFLLDAAAALTFNDTVLCCRLSLLLSLLLFVSNCICFLLCILCTSRERIILVLNVDFTQ